MAYLGIFSPMLGALSVLSEKEISKVEQYMTFFEDEEDFPHLLADNAKIQECFIRYFSVINTFSYYSVSEPSNNPEVAYELLALAKIMNKYVDQIGWKSYGNYVQIYNDHNRSWITYRAAHLSFELLVQDLQTSGSSSSAAMELIKNRASLGDEVCQHLLNRFNGQVPLSLSQINILFTELGTQSSSD